MLCWFPLFGFLFALLQNVDCQLKDKQIKMEVIKAWRLGFAREAPGLYTEFLELVRGMLKEDNAQTRFDSFKAWLSATLRLLVGQIRETYLEFKKRFGKKDKLKGGSKSRNTNDLIHQVRPLKDLVFENFYEYYG